MPSFSLRALTLSLKSLLLACVIAAASTALALSMQFAMHARAASQAGVVFLSTERLVPGETGVQRFDAGWSPTELQSVKERLRRDFHVLGLATRLSSVEVEAGRIPVVVFSLSAPMDADVAALLPGGCDQGSVVLSPALARLVPESAGAIRLDAAERALLGSGPDWLFWLDSGQSRLFVVECAVGRISQTGTLLAVSTRASAMDAEGVRARLDAATLLQAGHFERVVKVESAHTRVERALDAGFAWLRPVLVGALLMLGAMSIALGLMDGLGRRGDARLRRVLGARPLHLLSDSLRPALVIALPAAGLAALAMAWISARGLQVQLSPSLLGATLLALVSCSLALLTAASWAARLLGLEPSLTHDKAGRGASSAIRAQLLAWTAGIALVSTFVVAALGVGLHALGLQRVPLGYTQEGLVSMSMRLPLAEQSGDALRSRVVAMQAWFESELTGSSAWTLACNPPWGYGSEPLHRVTDRSIGTFVGLGPRGLSVLAPENWRGEDFDAGNWSDPQAVAMQARSESERTAFTRGRRVLAEVEGVQLGAAAPHFRSIVLMGLPAFPECADLHWMARPPITLDQAHALARRMEPLFPELAVSPPYRVQDFINEQRAPLRELAWFLTGICMASAMGQVALALALAMLLVSAQRRALAIRRALGANLRQLLAEQVRRFLPWLLGAMGVGLGLALAGQSVLGSVLVDYSALSGLWVATIVLAIGCVLLAVTLIAWSSRVLRHSLSLELGAE